MRSAARIAVVVVSLGLLVVGVVLGFGRASATLTEVQPQLRQIEVSCGDNYLRHTPPAQAGDLVALPEETGVLVSRAAYSANCDAAVGWRRYAAWGLTALGALGLAVVFSAARTPSGPGRVRPRGVDTDSTPAAAGPDPDGDDDRESAPAREEQSDSRAN